MSTTEKEKKSRKDITEILETDCEDREEITLLLEKGLKLKQQIGVAPDDKKGVEGSGLLREMHELKEELAALQKIHGMEGLRHNNIAFVLTPMEGRETMDPKKLAEELVARNIDPKVVAECMKLAMKQGEGYYKREIVDLNAKRGKKGE